MRSFWKILGASVLAAGVTPLHAQTTIAGTVGVRLVLEQGCTVTTGANATAVGGATGVDFGLLDFGTQPSFFTGALSSSTAGSTAASATQIICSADMTTLNVTVNTGLHAGSGTGVGTGSRAMVNASDATAFVPYDVYTDAAAGSQYVAGTAQSYTIPVPGQAFSLPVFGRISKTSANALPSGTYTDTLNVTLGW